MIFDKTIVKSRNISNMDISSMNLTPLQKTYNPEVEVLNKIVQSLGDTLSHLLSNGPSGARLLLKPPFGWSNGSRLP